MTCTLLNCKGLEWGLEWGDASIAVHVAISDHVFAEFAEVFFGLRPYLSARQATVSPVAWHGRRYQTRKAIAVPMAAAITGLSESTIKRLDGRGETLF